MKTKSSCLVSPHGDKGPSPQEPSSFCIPPTLNQDTWTGHNIPYEFHRREEGKLHTWWPHSSWHCLVHALPYLRWQRGAGWSLMWQPQSFLVQLLARGTCHSLYPWLALLQPLCRVCTSHGLLASPSFIATNIHINMYICIQENRYMMNTKPAGI